MSNRPVKETKSQIAYRQASEAKAASEALKLSIQNTERDNRQSGRDAQSTSISSTRSIVTNTIASDMISVENQLVDAKKALLDQQILIDKLKQVETAYYANIETAKTDKANKESSQLEILTAQTAAAQAQTLAAQAQANLETIRLEALKYAKRMRSIRLCQTRPKHPQLQRSYNGDYPLVNHFFLLIQPKL